MQLAIAINYYQRYHLAIQHVKKIFKIRIFSPTLLTDNQVTFNRMGKIANGIHTTSWIEKSII